MMFYSGKSGYSQHYNAYLVPVWGGCSSTGMTEEAALLTKVSVYTDMDKEDSQYSFHGFVRVTTIPATDKDQTSDLAN